MDLYLNSLFPLILWHSDYCSRLSLLSTCSFFWQRRESLLNVDNLSLEELVSLLREAIPRMLPIRSKLNLALSQRTFLCLVSVVNANGRKQDQEAFAGLFRQSLQALPCSYIIIRYDKFHLHPDFNDLHLYIHVTRQTKYCKVYHEVDNPKRCLLRICSQGRKLPVINGTLIKEKVPIDHVMITVISWYYYVTTSS